MEIREGRGVTNKGKRIVVGRVLRSGRLGKGYGVCTRIALSPKYSLKCRRRRGRDRACCVLHKRKGCSSGKHVHPIGTKSIAFAPSKVKRKLAGAKSASLMFVTLVVLSWYVMFFRANPWVLGIRPTVVSWLVSLPNTLFMGKVLYSG